MFNYQKILGNLYLACLVLQITSINNLSKLNHNSLVLKSIDNVINNIYFIKNENVNLNNTNEICYESDAIHISNVIFSFLQYYSIFFISVIILEFLILQNKTQGIFLSLCTLCVYYAVIWKHLLKIWDINYNYEHVWLGVATMSFTTLSNSLSNTKEKRNKLHTLFKYINIPHSYFISIYNHVYMFGLLSAIILCIISNQYILGITFVLYVSNLILCPQYFLTLFEILSIIYLNLIYIEYYNLLSLLVYFGIFMLYNTYKYVIEDNIITIISIKTIGIFFNTIYVKYLC